MPLRQAWIDIALVLAVLACASLLFVGASSLPPPRFEPMGSAALPRILAGLLIFFSLLIGIKAIARLGKGDSVIADEVNSQSSMTETAGVQRAGLIRAASVLTALVLYVVTLDFLQWPFIAVTAVFVTIVGSTLSTHRLQAAWRFALFGTLLATALYVLMTRFLYVDLG